MNLSPIALWASLQTLPWFFSIFVFSVVLLSVCLLFLLPFYYLLRSEPRVLSQWAREHYATVVTRPAQHGAQAGELFFGKLSFLIDVICVVVGRLVAWLAIFMAVMQFVVVVMRYVFAYGSIQMQESIWYMHGVLFMAAHSAIGLRFICHPQLLFVTLTKGQSHSPILSRRSHWRLQGQGPAANTLDPDQHRGVTKM